MADYAFMIPGWHPAKVNELYSGHWGHRARLKKADRDRVAHHARLAGIPAATGKRRVSLRLTLAPRQRAGDPDAYWKSLLDALVHAGQLIDDNRQNVELGPVVFDRGPARATTVLLEDVGATGEPVHGLGQGGRHLAERGRGARPRDCLSAAASLDQGGGAAAGGECGPAHGHTP
jgi:hypothetical protein